MVYPSSEPPVKAKAHGEVLGMRNRAASSEHVMESYELPTYERNVWLIEILFQMLAIFSR